MSDLDKSCAYGFRSRMVNDSVLYSGMVMIKNLNQRVTKMRNIARKIDPEDYILSVLSPEDRLDAAFKVAGEAFKKTRLTVRDINNAVKSVRRKAYAKKT